MSGSTVRQMQDSDLDRVLEIQAECYREVEPESLETLNSKRKFSPESCWVGEIDGEVCAYLICHPWERGSVPPLDTEMTAVSCRNRLFYVHDLAVSALGRGVGIGRALVDSALSFAKVEGYARAALTAVQSSAKFWNRFGFVESAALEPAARGKLSAYGEGAAYMELVIRL